MVYADSISDPFKAVMLPNTKGEVDMSIHDSSFNEWCVDVFNHYWELAGPARLDKTKIV